MKEELLQQIWRHKKIPGHYLTGSKGETIHIIDFGNLNTNSGPDFLNAQIRIDGQLWAGNVEIHVKASDWYLHKHQNDDNYKNVILHVVWENDKDVSHAKNFNIPTLILADYIDQKLLKNYHNLLQQEEKFINCNNDINEINEFDFNNWIERMFFERLESKVDTIINSLKRTKNDWEAVFFEQLAKVFGSKVNGHFFYQVSRSFDFKIFKKNIHDLEMLEALLFGQSNLLNEELNDAYLLQLQSNYQFLTSKFKLTNVSELKPKFFRLRPYNFPTIRLSQLANLYYEKGMLFSEIIEANKIEEYLNLFDVSVSDYWKTHYTFNSISSVTEKKITKAFIELILINAVVPVKFAFWKYKGQDHQSKLIDLMSTLNLEKNKIIDQFYELRPFSKNALLSQGLLQLKSNYCDQNKCLDCAIGHRILFN
ncbi:MAG: DUF2851 family protein [bacterium]